MAVIGLDATSISIYGKGLSRYQYNLLNNLAKLDEKNSYYVFLNKKNIMPQLPGQNNFHYLEVCIPARILWEQFELPAIIKKLRLDMYYTTSDILPFFSRINYLIYLFEIPDYRINLSKQGKGNSLYSWISQRYIISFFSRSMEKASLIIAGSYSTKNDLVREYSLDERKIRVVHPGCDESFCMLSDRKKITDIRRKYDAESGYIFHISSRDPRDNTPTVMRAYKNAFTKLNVPKKLVIFGDVDPVGLQRLAGELELRTQVIFTGRLGQKELLELYQAADVYIDPSFFEGFGLQVLEAMACGIPVIASNATSLPEVVGDAGILLNPNDIDAFSFALVEILNNDSLRQSMCRKSIERARFFSWRKTAEETLGIFNALLK